MEPDPLRHFDQQFESYELLNQHRDLLIADARAYLREHPDARLAGLICTPDSPDFGDLRRRLQPEGGPPSPPQGLVGIVPLAWIEATVDRLAPHLPPVDDNGQLRLPVIVSTREGQRLGVYAFASDVGS